ncbi:SMC-Scp complex subunit ScpB [Paenibacillus alvei]|uniref:Segregation and condensation protein B n=1 Tax=Paenibacillus alvei TaxID=44250 RepID=A0ABT4GTK0_PAEAL|nr:SMC-Scp complex subunit ScpB [Paenibacillus alvei]EJW18088.1 segregation and condensation protein B [Paenibacillus alvei DSM 29]MCY7487350.1 SMC-Scp complex subunit ScpB [Paenibacillus alvei]MCY9542140.1 SMC-Scp complex subunit ScpB [Paenibacillus alvei]MCY9703584.1 SMC-Scp complex subunit ScpB [Paenibacillus alvei]MCY9732465.1 SMC-Scp complex subunit ScpB [Paenibacillus alvei]
MDFQTLKSIIEGLLFMAGDEGLNIKQISEITEQRPEVIEEAVNDLRADFERSKRGLQIVAIAGMYELATLPEHAPYFERMAYSPSRSSLSQAALETLSIVAYRQPITRVEIEEIRGVKSDRAIQTLTNKGLIEEVGRAEAIGRPILYGTTKSFLDYFGLATLKELPDSSAFEQMDGLEEETQLLFEKLDGRQLTIEDVKEVEEQLEAGVYADQEEEIR